MIVRDMHGCMVEVGDVYIVGALHDQRLWERSLGIRVAYGHNAFLDVLTRTAASPRDDDGFRSVRRSLPRRIGAWEREGLVDVLPERPEGMRVFDDAEDPGPWYRVRDPAERRAL